jgi:hypothetical protein
MAYIGNQQTQGFSQVPAKQDLTGAAGTSLTLTHAVASAEGIDLFINNVRQESGEAYSIAGDGVTVTLTGSVVATDDIYVVYNSLALQTTVPPDASVSTAKIIDGSVTSAKLDTSISVAGDLTVDTTTLHVDSTNNRVGIGSASPLSDLSVESSIGGVLTLSTSDTTGTSGDSLGKIDFYSGDTSTGSTGVQARISGVYDSNGDSTALTFTTGTSTGSGSPTIAERMRIDSAGGVRIGNTTNIFNTASAEKFTIKNSGNGNALTLQSTNVSGGFPILYLSSTDSTASQNAVVFQRTGGGVGTITTSASATAYNTSSDYRLKTAVTYDWDATTRLKQLKPARFNFIVDADTTVDGFLAHEVQTVVPEAITGTKDEVDADGNPVMQGIDQSKLVPLLVKTIQELEARITALEAN